MIQLTEVNSQIKEIETMFQDQGRFKKSELSRARKLVVLLRSVSLYLESNPSEDFINSMLVDLEKKLKNINDNYPKWIPPDRSVKNIRAAYDTEMGTKKVKAQIKTLKYILEI